MSLNIRIGGSHTDTEGFFTRKLNQQLSVPRPVYKRKHKIRPSEITDCTRKIVYDILNFPSKDLITPKQRRIFDNGNYVHSRYLEHYIKKLGCAAHVYEKNHSILRKRDFVEISVSKPEYWLHARPDAVIVNEEDGLPYIFELKSIKQEMFNRLSSPLFNCVAQVQLYMFMLNIPRAIVFYENKNNQETKEFVLYNDQELLNKLINKIRKIQAYVRNYTTSGIIPDREYEERICNMCKFSQEPTGCITDWKE